MGGGGPTGPTDEQQQQLAQQKAALRKKQQQIANQQVADLRAAGSEGSLLRGTSPTLLSKPKTPPPTTDPGRRALFGNRQPRGRGLV